ncbi:TetR/AcrR family transcriptional regulator [Gordonia hydrophobica]|nr:TetR/AcrR family transcriptional regulator [Gordonia hydrophobica]
MAPPQNTSKRPYAPRMTPEERREQLLDTVLRVIVERGVHKVSIESVAEAAGVTRPVVYKHFDDSAALLRASLAREEARAIAQCYEAGEHAKNEVSSGSQPDFGLALFANLLRMFTASPELWSAILQLVDSATPQFRKTIDRGREQAADMVAQLLTAYTNTGDENVDADRDLHARLIVALIIESGRLILARPEEFTIERLVAGMRFATACSAARTRT